MQRLVTSNVHGCYLCLFYRKGQKNPAIFALGDWRFGSGGARKKDKNNFIIPNEERLGVCGSVGQLKPEYPGTNTRFVEYSTYYTNTYYQ